MKRIYAPATTLVSLAIVTIVASSSANAVTPTTEQPTNAVGQALEIAPPVLNIKGNPGDTIETKIMIRDVSTSPLRVTSQVNDFTANGEDGSPKVLLEQAEPSPYSIIKWVSPLAPFTLQPKQLQSLPVSIKIPSNAAPGGYYGVIRFTATAPNIEESGVSLSASLGTIVLLRVNGDATESMNVEEFYTSDIHGRKTSFFEGIPFNFTERVKNTGNVYEQPTGRILIKDMFGNVTANVNVNLEQRNVLPNTVRKFDQPFDKAGLGDRFLFGPYTAELTLDYGTKKSMTETLSFWVIPYKLIAAIIIAIILIVVGLRVFLKRYRERVIGKTRGRTRRR
jgi:hypothetical protein